MIATIQGVTFGLNLGASLESLKHPQAHANFQATLRHLATSFKIESLTPTIKAEMTQLKARAEQVQRQECIEQAKRSKPFPWCEKYLKP